MSIEDQAYQSGVVNNMYGPSGLLQTLYNFMKGTEVAGETLAGSGVSWAGSLANSPVGYGRLIVDYLFSTVAYQAIDDGAGNINGTNITAGTIDYVTGAYSITFSGTPDAAPTADYLYGLPGQDWRVLMYENSKDSGSPPGEPFGSDCKQMVLQNTGNSGLENVMIGFREWFDTSENRHGWDLNGYINWTPGQYWNANYVEHGYNSYNGTRESWNNHPQIPLIDDTMYYWFYANRQRVMVVVKVQSNYESIYLGFGFRYGLPSEYPYPLVVNGCSTDQQRFDDTVGANRLYIPSNYWNDNGYAFWVVDPSNAWRIADGGSGQYAIRGCYLEPRLSYTSTGDIFEKTPTARLAHLQNVYVIYPQGLSCLMQLDGCLHLASANVQSEDTLHMGGIRHRVFQNIENTNYYNFMALEEIAGTTTTTTTTTTSTSTTSTTQTTTTTTTITTTTTTTSV
jgi:hypothetical protein